MRVLYCVFCLIRENAKIFCDVHVVEKLTTELDAIPGEMETLDRDIARAEHAAAERLVARLGCDVEVR